MGATIKDVAKLAGTSTATVSKVMNGSYSISQETADKVRKASQEYSSGRLCGIYPECSGYQAGRRVCDPCVSDFPGTG